MYVYMFFSCIIMYHQNVQVSCADRCSMLYLNCIQLCIVLNLFILLWHSDVAFAHVPRQFNWHLQVWVALRHRSKRGLWSGGHVGGRKVQLFHQATRRMSKLLELLNQLAKQTPKVCFFS